MPKSKLDPLAEKSGRRTRPDSRMQINSHDMAEDSGLPQQPADPALNGQEGLHEREAGAQRHPSADDDDIGREDGAELDARAPAQEREEAGEEGPASDPSDG